MSTTVINESGAQAAGPEVLPTGRETLYRELTPRRTENVPSLLDELVAALAGLGYSRRDRMSVRLAVEEAVVNGLRHGNRDDPRKRVRVRYYLSPEVVLVEVEDEGPGFDPVNVPDPTAPENLDRPSGRGLFLMRHCMSWLRYHGRGNRLTLCKYPSRC
jgi:serine/threonine-protein kinase RsbW